MDLARRGLASVRSEGSAFWEEPAARMVDAQAPGLAAAIRRIGEAMSSGEGWPARATDMMGRLSLLLSAAEKIDTLPSDLAHDVRVALGWTQSKEDAMNQPGVRDRWMVLGQIVEDEERLRVQRTWLAGRTTGRFAVVIDFAVGQQPLDVSLQPGTEFDGEVSFYPSCVPLRGLVKSRHGAAVALQALEIGVGEDLCERAMRRYAEALAKLPWISRWPMVITGVKPGFGADRWSIVDQLGRSLPIASRAEDLWRMISVSGGRAINLIGEWDGENLQPLAIPPGAGSEFEDLAPRWSA